MLTRFHPAQWSLTQAAHLLNRAGFGGSPAEIAALQALGLEAAVEKILRGDEDDDLFPPPALTQPDEYFASIAAIKAAPDDAARRDVRRLRRREEHAQLRSLRAWWLNRMRYSPHPLREKMTLFWHGHFATNFNKVHITTLMWRQNETLRAFALGDFRELTKQISKDPAMMRYLDIVKSGRKKPNENFSRELMELFTLGEGICYTEGDVWESARAFTGYRINLRTMNFRFVRRQFDSGAKRFLGRSGSFTGDDIIDVIADQEECSEFITRKIWTFFVADNPPPNAVGNLAAHFRQSGFDTRSVLREIFLSEDFYSPAVIRSQVKSPVQWLVQTARVLEAPLPPSGALEAALAQMGQVPFAPPNVSGWNLGRAWISCSTLLLRYNLAGYVVSGKPPRLDGFRKGIGPVPLDLAKIAPPALRTDPIRLCDALAQRLFNAPLPLPERSKLIAFLQDHGPEINDACLRDFLHLLMSTPEYQLT